MAKGIRYTDEFKQEAVNQVVVHGYLGISSKSLYDWMKKFSKPRRQREEDVKRWQHFCTNTVFAFPSAWMHHHQPLMCRKQWQRASYKGRRHRFSMIGMVHCGANTLVELMIWS